MRILLALIFIVAGATCLIFPGQLARVIVLLAKAVSVDFLLRKSVTKGPSSARAVVNTQFDVSSRLLRANVPREPRRHLLRASTELPSETISATYLNRALAREPEPTQIFRNPAAETSRVGLDRVTI